MNSTYKYNYLVADEVLGHTTYPDAFEHVFAHARANGSRNINAECRETDNQMLLPALHTARDTYLERNSTWVGPFDCNFHVPFF